MPTCSRPTSRANFSGANLTDATVKRSALQGTILAGATLTGIVSGGKITGTPASLPPHWVLVGTTVRYLVGSTADPANADLYGTNLADTDLADANLSNANLTFANLTGADLSGATLTGVTWSDTTCPGGTNSNNDGGTPVSTTSVDPTSAGQECCRPRHQGSYCVTSETGASASRTTRSSEHAAKVGSLRGVPNPDDVKDVLSVIGLYEDGDEDVNNALIDEETGLDPTTVDEVLDYLWRSDQIEAIMTLGPRHPSLDDIRRVLPDRERLWGEDGRRQSPQ